MAERSNIEWCDATFNPWIGCTKISPACDHCYAERDFDLRLHVVQWGVGQTRKRTGDDNWKKPGKWNAKPFFQCEVCGLRTDNPMRAQCKGPHRSQHMWKPARRRVFCASLADVFDNEVPVQWRRDLFDLIAATPNLDWLLLTKRIGNAKTMMADALHLNPAAQAEGRIWPLPNVWLGATICNQDEADRDIPKLLSVPAAVRFLSIEPMLGPVDLTDIVVRHGSGTEDHFSALYDSDDDEADTASYIDWVICGGESGPHARPMHPQWARDLRDQCAVARVPFMFKQWGEFCPTPDDWRRLSNGGLALPDDSIFAGMPSRQIHCNFDDYASSSDTTAEQMRRIGKKAAGRLLDGRTHDGFPKGGA
jgi:protein gp37